MNANFGITRRAMLGVLAAGVAPFGRSQAQGAQVIRLIVPFTVGTGPDLLARILGEELRQSLDQTIIVDNKPGASGNIGTQLAARANPDGLTLLITVNTFVMNASLFNSLPYDPVKSFVPISEISTGALALVVNPAVKANNVSEFIALAKSKPGELNYASPGRGTPQHLAMELFKLTAKVNLTHIPYPGSAGAVKDLLGGQVSAMFLPVHTALPLAASNQIRILAVGSKARAPQAPNVPTLVEQGVPEFDVDLWYGALAPAGTPKEIIDRYNKAINAVIAEPRVQELLGKQGMVAHGGPPEQLADLIAQDGPRWAKVVKDAGITAE
jgi:tripartite-type tricarboxylate transporter receptor subunit TctC